MEQNSTAPSDWIHFGEEGWGRNTTQLPQTGYTLGRRGGGEKQHSSLRLDTLWRGGVGEKYNTTPSDWIHFGEEGWGRKTAQLPQTGYTLGRRGGRVKQHNALRLDILWGVRWGSRTKCLPQFSALGRWGGKQFKTIVLRTSPFVYSEGNHCTCITFNS